MASSKVCIPTAFPVCMTDAIWTVLASRMRFPTAGVQTKISSAAQRPFLSIRLNRFCATTTLSAVDSVFRICGCSPWGKTSTIRSTVLAAFSVCSVPKTKCPVAAASTAREMVSRSRISPTRIMSGSSRNAPRNADANVIVCSPTSRWFTMHP